jgi:WD40 repeat protein
VRVWNRQTGQLERELKAHKLDVQQLVRSRAGYIAAGSDDQSVSCWDLAKSQPIWHDVHESADKVNALAFDAEGFLLATGRSNGLLSLRTTQIGKLIVDQQFPDSIHSLAFSPGIAGTPMSWLAIGDRGGSIHLVSMNDIAYHSGLIGSSPEHFSIRQIQGHEGKVYSLQFSRDASKLISAGEDGRLRLWNLNSEQSTRALGSDVQDFALIDNDHFLTIGKQALLHNLRAGTRQELPGLAGTGTCICYNAATDRIWFADGSHRLVTVSRNGTDLKVVRPRSASEVVNRIAVSPDGTRFAVAFEEQGKRWLELRGGSVPVRVLCESVVHDLMFSPDGGSLLLDQVRDLQVIRFPTDGSPTATSPAPTLWKGHRSTIWDLAGSRDGRYFATSSRDRQVKIWDWPTGREVWSAMAHAIGSDCVAFSPDGKTLATTGEDRLLRLWRWQQGTLVLEYPLDDWPAEQMEFTPDGTKLMILARSRLRLYDATPKEER